MSNTAVCLVEPQFCMQFNVHVELNISLIASWAASQQGHTRRSLFRSTTSNGHFSPESVLHEPKLKL